MLKIFQTSKKESGFTLLETVVVIAIIAVLSGVMISSQYMLKNNKSSEQKVLQEGVENAVVGYYGILGIYPPVDQLGLGISSKEVALNGQQVKAIATELQRYSGYVFIPDEAIKQYQFKLYYPNAYVFKIFVEPKM